MKKHNTKNKHLVKTAKFTENVPEATKSLYQGPDVFDPDIRCAVYVANGKFDKVWKEDASAKVTPFYDDLDT